MNIRHWTVKNHKFLNYAKRSATEVQSHLYVALDQEYIDKEKFKCLFYMSFLKYISGDIEESKEWFFKIRFLENDYVKLHFRLSGVPLVKSDESILAFLNSFDNASLYVLHDNYKNRYKFEIFMFRLIFDNE